MSAWRPVTHQLNRELYCSTVSLVYDMKSFQQLNSTNINHSRMGSNSLPH